MSKKVEMFRIIGIENYVKWWYNTKELWRFMSEDMIPERGLYLIDYLTFERIELIDSD